MDPLKISILFWEDRSQGHADHDEVVDQVAAALTEGGHKASLIGISSDLRELLDKLDEQKPQMVFNLVERCLPGARIGPRWSGFDGPFRKPAILCLETEPIDKKSAQKLGSGRGTGVGGGTAATGGVA